MRFKWGKLCRVCPSLEKFWSDSDSQTSRVSFPLTWSYSQASRVSFPDLQSLIPRPPEPHSQSQYLSLALLLVLVWQAINTGVRGLGTSLALHASCFLPFVLAIAHKIGILLVTELKSFWKEGVWFYCPFCFTSRSRTHDCWGQDHSYRGSPLAHWCVSECVVTVVEPSSPLTPCWSLHNDWVPTWVSPSCKTIY